MRKIGKEDILVTMMWIIPLAIAAGIVLYKVAGGLFEFIFLAVIIILFILFVWAAKK